MKGPEGQKGLPALKDPPVLKERLAFVHVWRQTRSGMLKDIPVFEKNLQPCYPRKSRSFTDLIRARLGPKESEVMRGFLETKETKEKQGKIGPTDKAQFDRQQIKRIQKCKSLLQIIIHVAYVIYHNT